LFDFVHFRDYEVVTVVRYTDPSPEIGWPYGQYQPL